MKLVVVFEEHFKIEHSELVELAMAIGDLDCVKEVTIYDS